MESQETLRVAMEIVFTNNANHTLARVQTQGHSTCLVPIYGQCCPTGGGSYSSNSSSLVLLPKEQISQPVAFKRNSIMLIRYQEEALHLQRAAVVRGAMLCKHLLHLCPESPPARVFH